MSDQNQASVQPTAAPEPTEISTTASAASATLKRIFKIGATRIAEDATTSKLDNEAVRAVLKATFPEVAYATIREMVNGDTRLVEYLPKPGTKG